MMNQVEHTEACQSRPLIRRPYEAPQLICLNKVAPETGNYVNINENTGGMLES